MRFIIILLLLSSVIAGVVGVLYVNSDLDPMDENGIIVRQTTINKLGLTDDQLAKIKNLDVGMDIQEKDAWGKIKTIYQKEKEALLSQNPSQPAVYGYSKEISDLQSELAEKKLEYLLKIKEVLNPNQFKKLLHLEMGRLFP